MTETVHTGWHNGQAGRGRARQLVQKVNVDIDSFFDELQQRALIRSMSVVETLVIIRPLLVVQGVSRVVDTSKPHVCRMVLVAIDEVQICRRQRPV